MDQSLLVLHLEVPTRTDPIRGPTPTLNSTGANQFAPSIRQHPFLKESAVLKCEVVLHDVGKKSRGFYDESGSVRSKNLCQPPGAGRSTMARKPTPPPGPPGRTDPALASLACP